MPRMIDLTGQVLGRLKVLERTKLRGRKEIYWRCQCECGKLTIVMAQNLRSTEAIPGVQSVVRNAGSVQPSKPCRVPKLRRALDQGMRRVGGIVFGAPRAHRAETNPSAYS